MLFEIMSKIGTGTSNQQGLKKTHNIQTWVAEGGRGCSATITSTFLAGLVLVVAILGTKIKNK